MADNKNQAQLLEDYGQNVLSGAGGGSGGSYLITLQESSGSWYMTNDNEEIVEAYNNGAVLLVQLGSNGSAVAIAIKENDELADVSCDILVPYVGDVHLDAYHVLIEDIADPDNYTVTVTSSTYTLTPST